jgi:hypothetical protein
MADRLPFAVILSGGHSNSLGRTVEVVEMVLADPAQFEQLYQCYFDGDEVVRLRTSNAVKRLWRERADLVLPYLDHFLNEIAQIDQPSTRWTLAQMFHELDAHLTPTQRAQAVEAVKLSLLKCDDWIVINQSLEALAGWAKTDPDLRAWLTPHLQRFAQDRRKSIASKASRWLKKLN